MANNLFISYDLYSPGQNYERLAVAIKSLGNWAKVQNSFWYVNSTHSSSQAASTLRSVMDQNDSLIVVDATNNTANWYNLSEEISSYIRDHWMG